MISMPFQPDETVFLIDGTGKKVWVKVAFEMLKISSLGTIDGNRFKDLDDGSTITVVGREYTVFRPGAKDLMESLDRGAQIIIPKDAATILLYCDVKCGDKVIEVGAGSGGLTTALVSSVAPEGKVHTLELREDNALRVLKNLKRTGLDKYWSYTIGDAKETDPEMMADVLTMDMPDPWLALDNLKPHLRPGGRLCAYIPNTNQVESTVIALRERGFTDVYALENIQRELEVHPGGVRPSFDTLGHTGYLVFARKKSGV